jgi:cell division protein FtsB
MSSSRDSARRFWGRRLITAAAALWLGLGGLTAPTALAQGASVVTGVDEALARFTQLNDALAQLRQRRAALERDYQQLTDQIAARKRGRSPEALGRDLQLQALLQQARERADALNALQQQLRQREKALEGARVEILAAYDRRLSQLEDLILDPELVAARADAIAEMNRVRRERHAYVTPRASAPELTLEALPALSTDPRDPEEARAAAAELTDADHKLQRHILDLEAQIRDLEAERRLRRRAADFQERQTFFDDDRTGGRAVARATTGDRSAPATTGGVVTGDGPTRGSVSDSPNEAAAGGDNGAGAESDDAAAPPEATPEAEYDGALDADNAADPGVGAPQEPAGGGFVGAPTALPEAGLPGDPFSAGGAILQTDAATLNDPAAPDDRGEPLEARLARIKREREALQRRSQEIQERARDLQRLADEL